MGHSEYLICMNVWSFFMEGERETIEVFLSIDPMLIIRLLAHIY